jgi:hypothetical protein
VLDILKYIHSTAWPYMFGKKADDLQAANAADDEYMISDNDLLLGKFISIPKRDYSSFVPGSLVAGIVRGMLDAAGFPARWVGFLEGGGRARSLGVGGGTRERSAECVWEQTAGAGVSARVVPRGSL